MLCHVFFSRRLSWADSLLMPFLFLFLFGPASMIRKVVDRWLSVRLELLGNFVVLSATLLSVLAASNGRLIAGLAGLSITNALRSASYNTRILLHFFICLWASFI